MLVPPMSMTRTFIELHVSSVGEVAGPVLDGVSLLARSMGHLRPSAGWSSPFLSANLRALYEFHAEVRVPKSLAILIGLQAKKERIRKFLLIAVCSLCHGRAKQQSSDNKRIMFYKFILLTFVF